MAFGVAMLGWTTAALLLTRRFAEAGDRGWAGASGVAVAALLAPLAVMGAAPVLSELRPHLGLGDRRRAPLPLTRPVMRGRRSRSRCRSG